MIRYLNAILREKIIRMTVALGHRIPQPHHEAMSGKTQTGQIPLNKSEGGRGGRGKE